MNQVIYWNAPLWQLIIATLILIIAFGTQHWFIWRRQTLRQAIHNTDSNLATLPLFFFSELGGLLPLSDAAYLFLERNNLQKNDHMRLLMTLLRQTVDSNHIIMRNDDTIDPLSLITIPHFNPQTKQGGVLAVIIDDTINFTTHTTDIENASLPNDTLHDWVQIDNDLMVHLFAPKIQIKREKQWIEKHPSHLQQQLLRYFINNIGQSVSYHDLFQHIWTDEQIEHPGLAQHQREKLRAQIYHLRQLIEQDTSTPQKINTIHSYGYIFHGRTKMVGGIDA